MPAAISLWAKAWVCPQNGRGAVSCVILCDFLKFKFVIPVVNVKCGFGYLHVNIAEIWI